MTRVIRPKWSGSADQLAALETAIKICREADEKRAEGWEAIQRARLAGVPDELLCERTGWSRATLNRKLGPRP